MTSQALPITHEEATLLSGLLAAFKIIRMFAPSYIEARPASAELINQMLAAMVAIEEALAPFRQPKS